MKKQYVKPVLVSVGKATQVINSSGDSVSDTGSKGGTRRAK